MLDTILSHATVRRRLAAMELFPRLAAFDPRWVGSIPLDVHGPGADVDIACCGGPDLDRFKQALEVSLSEFGARVTANVHAGEPSVIARFEVDGLPFEIFGRARPVETHESYIHWLAEHRLLQLAEDRLRRDVRQAKLDGLKTEPAFAQVLGLGGDPYAELLKLASPKDDALRDVLRNAGYAVRG